MNKGAIIGIVIAIAIGIGVAVGFSTSPENGEIQTGPENGDITPEESSGRNLTIELEESITFQTNP